jgi:hypothetical protein
MAIPVNVEYTTTGKGERRKTVRNVAAVLCPTALNQAMAKIGFAVPVRPIRVELGDAHVDWGASSAGFEMMIEGE